MDAGQSPRPIFHLSFPVRDLDVSIAFYRDHLGAIIGRREAGWADVGLFGAQVTLQHMPGDVLDPMPRSRHFGATIGWDAWHELVGRLDRFVEPPTISYVGTPREQAKAMIADPSGNYIEVKAYRDARAVLGNLAA